MFFFVRLFGSKAIIHNSPFQKSCGAALYHKSNKEHGTQFNGLSFFFSRALWHNYLEAYYSRREKGFGDRKIRQIICSLVFKFDKLTGLRRNRFLALSVMLVRVGRAPYTVTTGHFCHSDELSDNNWVKRGNKLCHERMKWKESTDLFSKTIHARANQIYWEVLLAGEEGGRAAAPHCHKEWLCAPKIKCSTTRTFYCN